MENKTSIEQINELVLKYNLSETVKQGIIKIVDYAYSDAYEIGYCVALKNLED